MPILAYGINFRTASLDLRDKIALPGETLNQALNDLCTSLPAISEAAILSTCNRTELYCATELDDPQPLLQWLSDYRQITSQELREAAYAHWDQDAARHMMRVASGLDSQVLGEPQIMGQLKTAYEVARTAGTLGPELNLLSQLTLNVAKRVRTDTDIGRNPVSVAYAAVTLAQQIFTDLADTKALLLGAGETIELVTQHLKQQGMHQIAIANRTLANARELAGRFNAQSLQLTGVAEVLHEYDIVIASTGSPLPVLGKGTVEAALHKRKRKPMFMVDIAVPRDIEPEVATLRDVFLYSIDDLTGIIEENRNNRQHAAQLAEQIILEGAQRFFAEQRIRQGTALLQHVRSQADAIQARELQRALNQLSKGTPPEQVMEQLARALTNKLMHPPTMAIRNASANGHSDVIDYIRTLYNLDP